MPSSPAPGYLTDVAYLRTFSGDLAPQTLRLVAALNGFTPPPADDFDYCELGSGTGDTTATLAAACPGARFLGVDVNAEHTAFAEGLARAGGLSNVRFLERDFESLGREPLPPFQYVTAHGVLSWVSPEKRRALIALSADKLAPGGLLFVSYNALPGWAAIEPLRRLMLDAAPDPAEPTLERARKGFGAASVLSEAGAEYFGKNPAARSMLETMRKMGLPYVVHEYLQPHWHPLYFADVAREMAQGGLHFIGQLPIHQNYRDLALPPALLELFKNVGDRLAFESLKDFALNEFFRRDVYIKGLAPRSDEATARYLDSTAFGTLVAGDKLQRELRLDHYTLRYQGPLFEALIPALAGGASTVAELAARPELAGFGEAKIRASLLHLLLGGQVVPMARSAPAVGAASAARYRVPLDYNRMILGQRLADKTPTILASPPARTGFIVPMLEALGIRVLTEIEPGARAAWIRAFVSRQPLKLQVAGKAVESPEEQARVIEGEIAALRRARLPKLIELGVVAE